MLLLLVLDTPPLSVLFAFLGHLDEIRHRKIDCLWTIDIVGQPFIFGFPIIKLDLG